MQVHYILGELCFGGLALETNMAEILAHLDDQNKLEKQEVTDWLKEPNGPCPVVCILSCILFSSGVHFEIFSCCFGMFCHVGTSCSSVSCLFVFLMLCFRSIKFPSIHGHMWSCAFSFHVQYEKICRMN